MKVSIGIGGAASGRQGEVRSQVEYVLEAEKLAPTPSMTLGRMMDLL